MFKASEEYSRFNDAVNMVFFSGSSESRPVYLDLEEPEREQLCEALGWPLDLIEEKIGAAVRATLSLQKSDIYDWHKESLEHWHVRGAKPPPPFSGLLLALSLAAENMRHDSDYSAGNYYQRLVELLDIDCVDKLRASAKSTSLFWQALNRWLIANDFAYGRPTASQVNKWKHVSYAISQSLVRQSDRAHLRSMLHDAGFSGGQSYENIEVDLALHGWMETTYPSKWLKKLWSSESSRERVLQAALQEVANLDVDVHGDPIVSSRSLFWVLVLKKFPKKKFSFYLSSNSSTAAFLEIPSNLSPIQINKGSRLRFESLSSTEFEYVAPLSELNLPALFSSNIKLSALRQDFRFEKKARPIIPFARSEEGPYLREVTKIGMFESHYVLCHENWLEKVKVHLAQFANKGFKVITPSENSSLPAGWVLIEDVQMVAIPSNDVDENLAALAPGEIASGIDLRGGVRIHQGIWHQQSPPAVVATTSTGFAQVDLCPLSLAAKDQVVASNRDSMNDANFIKADELVGSEYKDFVLYAWKDKKKIAEKHISFRTADIARKIPSVEQHILATPLDVADTASWRHLADTVNNLAPSETFIQGFYLANVPEIDFRAEVRSFDGALDDLSALDNEEDYGDYQEVGGLRDSCILRGYHIWDCPVMSGFSDRYKQVRRMVCNDCGLQAISKKPPLTARSKKNTI